MAGGLFPNYPFELNPKCIIFSIIIIGIFFYHPPEMNIYWKIFVSMILFIVSYVSMAWYDYKFQCQKLALMKSSSKLGITDKFKPEPHTSGQTDRSKISQDEKDLEWQLINLFHVMVIAPLFIYIGINKNNSPQLSIILLIISLAFAVLYHGVRLLDEFNVISLAHVIVGGVGIYYGFKSERPEWFHNSLIGIGIYSGLKHGLYLIQSSH